MPNTNQQVLEMVEKEIRKNPDVDNETLFNKAVEKDKGVSKLSSRQFNARYPLQVKRRLANEAKASDNGKAKAKVSKPKAKKAEAKQEVPTNGEAMGEVRDILLDLVKEVAGADPMQMVDIVAGIDQYSDRVLDVTC